MRAGNPRSEDQEEGHDMVSEHHALPLSTIAPHAVEQHTRGLEVHSSLQLIEEAHRAVETPEGVGERPGVKDLITWARQPSSPPAD